jgi:hypothetical protein
MGGRSVLMTRGCGCEGVVRALRNSRLAASASRLAESQKIDRSSRRIDRSIQVAPAAFYFYISLVAAPRLVGGLQMASHPLL